MRSRVLDILFRRWRRPAPRKSKSMQIRCSLPQITVLRRTHSCTVFDEEEENEEENELKPRSPLAPVPAGCLAVYVGPDRRRFVIAAEILNHRLFRVLLEEAEQEYGFDSDGPLTLPCDVSLFKSVLSDILFLRKAQPRLLQMPRHEILST